jgi:hypothetical protein
MFRLQQPPGSLSIADWQLPILGLFDLVAGVVRIRARANRQLAFGIRKCVSSLRFAPRKQAFNATHDSFGIGSRR